MNVNENVQWKHLHDVWHQMKHWDVWGMKEKTSAETTPLFAIHHLLPPAGLASTSLPFKPSYKLCFPVVSPFFFPLNFPQPVYRAQQCVLLPSTKILGLFCIPMIPCSHFSVIFSQSCTVQSSVQTGWQQIHCNVILLSENRPPILDIPYGAFSSIYGWTRSHSFYFLQLHLSYWRLFFRCFSLFWLSCSICWWRLPTACLGKRRVWFQRLGQAASKEHLWRGGWDGQGVFTLPEELPGIWGGFMCIRLQTFPGSIRWRRKGLLELCFWGGCAREAGVLQALQDCRGSFSWQNHHVWIYQGYSIHFHQNPLSIMLNA